MPIRSTHYPTSGNTEHIFNHHCEGLPPCGNPDSFLLIVSPRKDRALSVRDFPVAQIPALKNAGICFAQNDRSLPTVKAQIFKRSTDTRNVKSKESGSPLLPALFFRFRSSAGRARYQKSRVWPQASLQAAEAAHRSSLRRNGS